MSVLSLLTGKPRLRPAHAAPLALLAVLALGTTAARAQQFTFTYNFPGDVDYPTSASGSGFLFTSTLDPITNAYTITGITGTRTVDGVTTNITGLIAPGNYAGNDNLLFASGPLLSSNGFSFTVDGQGNDGSNVNVYYNDDRQQYTENALTTGYGTFSVARITPPTAVPEPGEWAIMGMLGTSVCGLMVRARRKAR